MILYTFFLSLLYIPLLPGERLSTFRLSLSGLALCLDPALLNFLRQLPLNLVTHPAVGTTLANEGYNERDGGKGAEEGSVDGLAATTVAGGNEIMDWLRCYATRVRGSVRIILWLQSMWTAIPILFTVLFLSDLETIRI